MAEITDVNPTAVDVVYASIVAANEDYDNDKLSASEVGKECDRAIWYSWRWCSQPEEFTAPKLRVFKTGHVHEDMIIADLRLGGMKISDHDPDAKVNRHTGKKGQWEVRGLNGHFKGKLDGIILKGVPEAPATEHVLEVKTHNEKSFKKLLKEGVAIAKPEHYAQMQLYMHFRKLTRALYAAENKNDSTLYIERIEYDVTFCLRLLARLERIRDSERPPQRLHADPAAKAAFACGWCKARAQCHYGEFSRSNCRTCLHASPVDDGQWHCARWDKIIPYLEQRDGCGAHLFIPDLVPGEQVDCDTVAETVTYILEATGEEWIDGFAPQKEGRAQVH